MELVTAMIECPKGYNQKFDYEPKGGHFKLIKILPAGLVFPFDFGMIPGTKGEDGDPLDIIVISESSSFPGCLMDCRIIGAIKAEQTELDGSVMRNDRYIGVPKVSMQFENINTLSDLPDGMIAALEAFFENYNHQAGKQFKVIERLQAEKAFEILEKQL